MKLSLIQKKLKELLARVIYPRVGTIIGLQEEVGKLSKTIMDIEIYNRGINQKELNKNCANVFFALIDICNSYDVDLQNVSKERIEGIVKVVKEWEDKYGKVLEEKRIRFDE